MKFNALKESLRFKAHRAALQTQKHSPSIMFAGGVVGVVATTVMASKATLKIEEVLEDVRADQKRVVEFEHPEYDESDKGHDLLVIKTRGAMALAKLYAPTAVVGTISIALLTRSHVVLLNRNNAVMAAYAALDRGFKEYRKRVQEDVGHEKDLEYRHGYEERKEIKEGEDGPVEVTHRIAPTPDGMPSPYARFFDEHSPNWNRRPDWNQIFLNSQQNYMNDLLIARGHVFLNDVYDALGIERSQAGSIVGWVLDGEGDNYIDFGMYDGCSERARAFVNGQERSILLDFNVDGIIWNLI